MCLLPLSVLLATGLLKERAASIVLSQSNACLTVFNEHRNSRNAAICILFHLRNGQDSHENQ
jgi:hypothetical protein